MMERGAIGELIPEDGHDGILSWHTFMEDTIVYREVKEDDGLVYFRQIASFKGPKAIRLERVALFLTTEQS